MASRRTATGPRRRLLLRLAVACAAVAAMLAVAEWLVLPAISDQIWYQIRWSIEEHEPGKLRPVAGYHGVQTVGGGRQQVRHDAHGMRGPEPPPRRPGQRRVLFVGDSVTYGIGVHEDETFARRCAVALTGRRGAEVVAGIAACPGFGTVDHVALLRRVQSAFTPDLVVSCVFVENDLFDNLQTDRAVVAGYPLFQSPIARMARDSWRGRMMLRFKLWHRLERFLADHAPTLALQPGYTARERELWDGVALDQSVLFLEQDRPLAAIDRLLGIARESLRQLRDAAAPAPLAVVLIPSYVQYVPGLFASLAAARAGEQAHRRGAVQERLRRVCSELELPCLDLLPALRARGDPAPLLIPNDFHFTAAGHRFVAEQLTPWLDERLGR